MKGLSLLILTAFFVVSNSIFSLVNESFNIGVFQVQFEFVQNSLINPTVFITANHIVSNILRTIKDDTNHNDIMSSSLLYDANFEDINIPSDQIFIQKTIWSSVLLQPFLRIGIGQVDKPPILNGNYQLDEIVSYLSDTLTIDHIEQLSDTSIEITGQLYNISDMSDIYEYSFTLSCEGMVESIPKIKFLANITSYPLSSAYDHDSSNLIPRIFFYAASNAYESFHGFGESFTYFNLKGYRIPILVSEQGVGRGEEPITSYLNTNSSEGVGGHWYTTYAPKALYLTNMNHSILIDESVVMFIDLSQPHQVEFEVWSSSMTGYIFYGESWIELISSITSIIGRQFGILPAWSQHGAVVGLEGGTINVSHHVDVMLSHDMPITGVWLQDWVGLRHNYDGDRLIWNWELNDEYYPHWSNMVDSFSVRGAKILTYISPFFSDPTNYTYSNHHNFYEEGLAQGYFIKHDDGSAYMMNSLSIEFYMLDVTNPSAIRWMIDIIKNYTFIEAQSSGFMCDFGEYLPFDAMLDNHISPAVYHNLYPEAWAKIAMTAVKEAGMMEDSLFFMRSAWIRSPAYVPIFWLGDQLISWDGNDGLASIITGALSSGITGHSITHSDIGGYNTVTSYGSSMYYIRTPELLKRWSEFAAFGSALYRTHIGSSTTSLNAQVYSTNDSMIHFAEFAYIYSNLSSYRMDLMKQAGATGLPLMRPFALHYAYDPTIWTMNNKFNKDNRQAQYLFGEDFIIAPVLYAGVDTMDVYLPAHSGIWVHLWSGKKLDSETGRWIDDVPAGIGYPCVLYKSTSSYGMELHAYVKEMGYDTGYIWNDDQHDVYHYDYMIAWFALALVFSAILWGMRVILKALDVWPLSLRETLQAQGVDTDGYARLNINDGDRA